ncbi:hypothetical protein [Novosphingobium sp.]|uniref:hypothetical protein n=1 Tax=Novosphingobium sp. TaxID=1874826 RepID=UPI002B4A059D|nr:hypothetical protein [Novosphingobium sp.]HKR91363.1 hypothetical protein [Novosphingobium sp.]
MRAAGDERRLLGQSGYWSRFAVYMIGVPVLLLVGAYSLLTRSFALGILSILGIFPLAIWFRFVMMRRCRDIGWPAWLPWTAQALQILMFFMIVSGAATGRTAALRATSSGSLLIAFVDFVFVITLGCIGSRDVLDYREVFGDAQLHGAEKARAAVTYRPDEMEEGPETARLREDAAIARALEAYRNSSAVVRPKAPASRPAGFGRKGL